ncbi:AbgT family transporter [Anaeromicrobium sediminis]
MVTLIANILPYTIAFFILWSIQIVIWFLIGLLLGPGSPVLL